MTLGGLGIDTATLGFGCASIGSRIGARPGAQLLARAMDLGVTWFDLAPAYGAGEAETIFAMAAKGRREKLQICTKVGLAPPTKPVWKRALLPLARPVARAISPLRAKVRSSGLTRNTAITLTPDLLRGSLEASLRRLGTDRVELYALHNAAPETLANEEILRTLEDIKSSGMARAIGVASDRAAAMTALQTGEPFSVVQCAASDAFPDIARQADALGMGLVVHSIFGVNGALDRLSQSLKQKTGLAAAFGRSSFHDPSEALLVRARLLNPRGVVLCSTLSAERLERNLSAFRRQRSDDDDTLALALTDSL